MNSISKLIVTADIHGSYSSWLTVKALLGHHDKLVIAGDLFDTKYGNFSNADFQPETIKKDLKKLKQDVYYVYGNCDIPSFYPGYEVKKTFNAYSRQIFLYHGHRPYKDFPGSDIIIHGHTHYYYLLQKDGQIFMNPGSIKYPKRGTATYGIIDNISASIIELETGNRVISIEF
ncbi:YfcE family phosphodiesterase [bacterium]|nr:YfcE family phosphodiesterase [bacterium]